MRVPDKPRWFDSWRKYQKEAVERIVNSDKRYFVLEAPTGSGKSCIGMEAANLIDGITYYLVSTKSLQRQLVRDFPFVKIVKGRNNFKCLVDERLTADLCPYRSLGVECPKYDECPYVIHKNEAKDSRYVVWNYPMFLTNQTFVGDFDEADLIICDEAHTIEGELMKFIEIKFLYSLFDEVGASFPFDDNDAVDAIKDLKEVLEYSIRKIKDRGYTDLVSNRLAMSIEDVKKLAEYDSALRKVGMFLNMYKEDEWVTDIHIDDEELAKSYVSFKPIFVRSFSNLIFDWGEQILFMSATFPPISVFAKSLGIDIGDIEYFRLPSTFPRENRPIIYHPLGRMSRNSSDNAIEKEIEFIDEFLGEHPNDKILVHCVNYRNLNAVISAINSGVISVPEGMKVIYHTNSSDRNKALDEFKSSEGGAVLLSPSMETGVDLPYDECRYQIIMKVPYLDLGDKQTKVRAKIDREWYISQAAMRIVQASGRAVRAKDDWCHTYVLDECFRDLIRDKRLFPRWFLDAVAVEVVG